MNFVSCPHSTLNWWNIRSYCNAEIFFRGCFAVASLEPWPLSSLFCCRITCVSLSRDGGGFLLELSLVGADQLSLSTCCLFLRKKNVGVAQMPTSRWGEFYSSRTIAEGGGERGARGGERSAATIYFSHGDDCAAEGWELGGGRPGWEVEERPSARSPAVGVVVEVAKLRV